MSISTKIVIMLQLGGGKLKLTCTKSRTITAILLDGFPFGFYGCVDRPLGSVELALSEVPDKSELVNTMPKLSGFLTRLPAVFMITQLESNAVIH